MTLVDRITSTLHRPMARATRVVLSGVTLATLAGGCGAAHPISTARSPSVPTTSSSGPIPTTATRSSSGHPMPAQAPTTPAPAATPPVTTPPTTNPVVAVIPPSPQSTAAAAASLVVSDWAEGNRAAALAAATPAAVDSLFAAPYPAGNAISRGCSDAFPPVVCSYGPPGGGSGSLYQLSVTRAGVGWYVSSVIIES